MDFRKFLKNIICIDLKELDENQLYAISKVYLIGIEFLKELKSKYEKVWISIETINGEICNTLLLKIYIGDHKTIYYNYDERTYGNESLLKEIMKIKPIKVPDLSKYIKSNTQHRKVKKLDVDLILDKISRSVKNISIFFRNVLKSIIRTRSMESNIQPKEVKTTDIQPKEVKTTDIQPKEVKKPDMPKEVKKPDMPKEVKKPDVPKEVKKEVKTFDIQHKEVKKYETQPMVELDVDSILDKISRSGMKSLTQEELNFLEKASNSI
jgi:hypothetical protein